MDENREEALQLVQRILQGDSFEVHLDHYGIPLSPQHFTF